MADPVYVSGRKLRLVAPAGGAVAGVPLVLGDYFGLPSNDAAAGESVDVALDGVWIVSKAPGVSFAQGAPMFWDDAAGQVDQFGRFVGTCAVPGGSAAADTSTHLRVAGRAHSPSGRIDSRGEETAIISNDATEQTLYSLTIPAGRLAFGDSVFLRSVNEVTSLTSGELRMRVWLGPVGGTGLISGFFNSTTTGRTGFEFTSFMVIDTGAGPTAARLASGSFGGVDVACDLTVDNVINFTGQLTVADPANAYRGLGAFLGTI